MTNESPNNQIKNTGPTASKDPVPKRSGFFVMLDTEIEATPHPNGKPAHEVSLQSEELKNKARLIGGVTDEDLLKNLETYVGFRKIIHSIGISILGKQDQSSMADFVIINKCSSGTQLSVPCPTDGSETVLTFEDYEWSEDDNTPGKLAFEFDEPGAQATVSLKFYLHNGYHVPELTIEEPVAFESNAYQNMIKKSLLSKGNNKRLKAAIEKAMSGEDVTIAYIGGSITQGAGAIPIHTECYAYKSYLKFKQMFGQNGGGHIHFIKAGVGGTPSELGMIRYNRDVLRDGDVQPDIVVVEFAVNDADDETQGKCYESLCLKILSASNHPAVILLFSVFVNDWNLQDRLSPVGEHYGLPMVSVKDAVVDQFRLTKAEGNVISKRQYFYDIYHPTNDGHTVMADCLAYLFNQTQKSEKDKADISIQIPPIIGNDFVGIQLLDRKDNQTNATIEAGSFFETDEDLQGAEIDDQPFTTPQFSYNWMHTESSGNESFKLTINSRSLLLVFKDSGSETFGRADVLVDGQSVKMLDPHLINWTHCHALILYQEDVCRVHQVEIKMAAGEETKRFTILGFGYTS